MLLFYNGCLDLFFGIMFTRGVMHNIPDLRLWKAGNEYQEIASLCNDHGKGWGGAINAALAIEIYIKSFLSQEVLISIGDGVSQSFKKSVNGHDLFFLYEKIPLNLQRVMCEQYLLINSNGSFPDLLKKYKDVFFKGRYMYEENSIKSVGNDIIYFAEEVREMVLNVAKIVHR
jgi:hypothetical protein